MLYLISYGLHFLSALLFFVLIPFPFLIKGTMEELERLKTVLRVYRWLIWLAHGGLLLSLISGVMMTSSWFSLWLFFVLLIWLALGAFLGLTAKMSRITLERIEIKEGAVNEITKLRRFSLLLTLAIIVMFAVKFFRYV